jgi:spermidine synthase
MLVKNSDVWYSEYHSEDDVKLSFKIDEVLHTEQSTFQAIQIFKNETFGNFMVLDGYVQVTEKDDYPSSHGGQPGCQAGSYHRRG